MNADDFGFASDVNEGIVRSYREGIVRSVSLMANGAALDHAADLARRNPGLGVGCHLTLVQGQSVARPGQALPASLRQLLATPLESLDPRGEFRAQVDSLLARGIRPTHVDTHKHVHLLPGVLDAALRVADEYGIGWIRKPFDVPVLPSNGLRACLAAAVRPFRIPFEDRLRKSRCRTTEYFAGFAATGALQPASLAALLRSLPDGTGELVCHPGVCGPELERAETRLKQSRQAEMEALCSPAAKRAVSEHGIEIVSYRDLEEARPAA